MQPYYFYRVNNWGHILNLLRQSLYAEEMVCAMSSELFHIPKTKDLKGNLEMHNHLVPAYYHLRYSSRFIPETSKWRATAIHCRNTGGLYKNAENQDKYVREGLRTMEENASTEFKPFIKIIIKWQEQAESYLNQAKESLGTMGVPIPAGSEQQSGEYNLY
ncbi:hypothetical protein [Peribacillus frigoritolerans]|uniref:hypothetical protein n=1 Tax=Peribacillus frigoritolerans TaxID=450367 RepID=UPI00257007D3|nr:hypothetical protein [Peribacillus frigoritolerans]